MRLLLLFVFSLLSLSSAVSASFIPGNQCQSLLTPVPSVCAAVLPYQNVKVNFFTCRSDADYFMSQLPFLFSTLDIATTGFGLKCQQSLALAACQMIYSPCSPTNATAYQNHERPCRSTCSAVQAQCPGVQLQALIAAFLPNSAPQPAPLQAQNLVPADCSTSPFYSDDAQCIDATKFGVPAAYVPAVVPQPTCQTYNIPNGICAGTIDYPVFVPPGSSLAAMEANAAQYRGLLFLSPLDCLPYTARHICSLAFPKCSTDPLSRVGVAIPTPFPSLPCKSSCKMFREKCPGLISFLPAEQRAMLDQCESQSFFARPYTSCDASFSIPGQDDFPAAATAFNADASVFSTCFEYAAKPNTSAIAAFNSRPTSLQCPAPLLNSIGVHSNTINGGFCALPCESILFDKDEWNVINVMGDSFAVFSFVVNLFLFITWNVFPEFKKQNSLRMMFLAHLIFSLGTVVTWAQSDGVTSQAGCAYNQIIADQSYPNDFPDSEYGIYNGCMFEAVCHMFGVNAFPTWWMFISIDLYLKIVRGVKMTPEQSQKWFYFQSAFSWGFSGLMLFIAMGLKILGRASVLGECILSYEGGRQYIWPLFIWPLVIRALIGLFCIGSVMFEIARVNLRMNKDGLKGWFKHFRIVLYWLTVYWILFFIFLLACYSHFKGDTYFQSAMEYISCVLTNNGDEKMCGTRAAERYPINVWYLENSAIVSEGVINFLIYGTQFKIYKLWWDLLREKTGVTVLSRTGAGTNAGSLTDQSTTKQAFSALTNNTVNGSAVGGSKISINMKSSGTTVMMPSVTKAPKKNQIVDSSAVYAVADRDPEPSPSPTPSD